LISSKNLDTSPDVFLCAGIAEPVQRWLDQTASCSRHIQEDALLISQGKLVSEVLYASPSFSWVKFHEVSFVIMAKIGVRHSFLSLHVLFVCNLQIFGITHSF
jgi:hypothetical protein